MEEEVSYVLAISNCTLLVGAVAQLLVVYEWSHVTTYCMVVLHHGLLAANIEYYSLLQEC